VEVLSCSVCIRSEPVVRIQDRSKLQSYTVIWPTLQKFTISVFANVSLKQTSMLTQKWLFSETSEKFNRVQRTALCYITLLKVI